MSVTSVWHVFDMCLSGMCPQLLYSNPVGHVAVSMYVCEIAAQDRARCPCTFHFVSHEWLVHRLVAQISSFPPAAGATPACSRAPRRTSRGSSANPEGPVIYAVLLGLPDGCWSELLNRDHGSCKALQRLVKEAFLSAGFQDDYCVTCVPAMS